MMRLPIMMMTVATIIMVMVMTMMTIIMIMVMTMMTKGSALACQLHSTDGRQ